MLLPKESRRPSLSLTPWHFTNLNEFYQIEKSFITLIPARVAALVKLTPSYEEGWLSNSRMTLLRSIYSCDFRVQFSRAIFACDFAQIAKRCNLNIDLSETALSNLLLVRINLAKIALLSKNAHWNRLCKHSFNIYKTVTHIPSQSIDCQSTIS